MGGRPGGGARGGAAQQATAGAASAGVRTCQAPGPSAVPECRALGRATGAHRGSARAGRSDAQPVVVAADVPRDRAHPMIYLADVVSNTVISGGITAQAGRSRVKIAIFGWNNAGSSSVPA